MNIKAPWLLVYDMSGKYLKAQVSCSFAILIANGRPASAIQREANKGKQVPHTTTFAKGKYTLELWNLEPGLFGCFMISRWFQIKAQNDRSCCRETDRILVRSDLHSEKTAPQSLENSPPVGSAQVHPDKCWSNVRLISGWAYSTVRDHWISITFNNLTIVAFRMRMWPCWIYQYGRSILPGVYQGERHAEFDIGRPVPRNHPNNVSLRALLPNGYGWWELGISQRSKWKWEMNASCKKYQEKTNDVQNAKMRYIGRSLNPRNPRPLLRQHLRLSHRFKELTPKAQWLQQQRWMGRNSPDLTSDETNDEKWWNEMKWYWFEKILTIEDGV